MNMKSMHYSSAQRKHQPTRPFPAPGPPGNVRLLLQHN